MSELLFDFAANDEKTGFRLQRLEVYNWGTFHNRVWHLDLRGENTLLTGDIGSGKSTLVDALTTLLVPPRKISYNKAAGAETRERSLKSYMLGYFKSERNEEGTGAKAVSLRNQNSYSVILGYFHNEGYSLDMTLAQVFWIRDPSQPPTKLYVVADGHLSITKDFSAFGTDVSELRKRLRSLGGVELFDDYTPYAANFRRRVGIENDQALDLFNQTISMKSVGNLTDFVRTHMLEPFDPKPRIEALIGHFTDLNRAHLSVLKAKQQIEALQPLVTDGKRFAEVQIQWEALVAAREALRSWFAYLKSGLLEKRLANLDDEARKNSQKLSATSEKINTLRDRKDSIQSAMNQNGADRLESLRRKEKELHSETGRRQSKAQRLGELLAAQSIPYPSGPEDFGHLVAVTSNKQKKLTNLEAEFQNKMLERNTDFQQWVKEIAELAEELDGLRRRPSNLPEQQVALRRRMCQDLNLHEQDMPFAGELIEVAPDHQLWAGAAERVLRNFALSLLVPDEMYAQVSAWVNQTQLGRKLVYFRVREPLGQPRTDLHTQSLVHKLRIKPGTPLRPWLESEVARRFDYACTQDLRDFRREQQAITPAGQIKGGGERHEKDDRFDVNDKSRWVLGWTNQVKIRYLEKQKAALEKEAAETGAQLAQAQSKLNEIKEQQQELRAMGEYREWLEVDWETPSKEMYRIVSEIAELEKTSEILQTLSRQLEEVKQKISLEEKQHEDFIKESGIIQQKIEQAQTARQASLAASEGLVPESPPVQLASRLLGELQSGNKLTVESCDNKEQELRGEIQKRIDNEKKTLDRLQEKIIKAMSEFRSRWVMETKDLDASLEALPFWEKLLTQMETDDLPRFEENFKKLLNENTIREVASFQMVLKHDRESIKEKIERINKSLFQIDYNPSRYIQLKMDPTRDPEVRQFYQDLLACTENSMTGSGEQYTEAKFIRVKELIEKLQGREGSSEADKKWSAKVTDVRQAFVFSASDRWRETEEEYEHITDSSGKSGGQKEKLAYTILAAALAYQFGLDWNEVRSRSFRFVVIDEAFGRGSEESTEYGLRLFQKLRLQILVVTPLQKIHVIEPFIAGVGFVKNSDGQHSQIRNLSIETYRRERKDAVGP